MVKSPFIVITLNKLNSLQKVQLVVKFSNIFLELKLQYNTRENHKFAKSDNFFNRKHALASNMKFAFLKRNWPVSSVTKTSLSVREVRGSILSPVKSDPVSPTACHRRNVSSELCWPDDEPRRCAPPLVTRFGVIPPISVAYARGGWVSKPPH